MAAGHATVTDKMEASDCKHGHGDQTELAPLVKSSVRPPLVITYAKAVSGSSTKAKRSPHIGSSPVPIRDCDAALDDLRLE